jgi:hypothetical protein
MKKRRERLDPGMDLTTFALLVGSLGGLGIVSYGESLLGDIQGTGDPHAPGLADWQVHMGAACMGATAFVIILFLLELLGRQSRMLAWQSSWPWLPLVGLTALASFIRIPVSAVIVMAALDVFWAYSRTRGARGTPNSKDKITGSTK